MLSNYKIKTLDKIKNQKQIWIKLNLSYVSDGTDGWDGMVIIGHRSWTMIVQPRGVPQSYLTLKWQILQFFCPLGSFFWFPKKSTRCFGLPATRWFLKLNRVGSGIERNTGYWVGFGYPLGTEIMKSIFDSVDIWQICVWLYAIKSFLCFGGLVINNEDTRKVKTCFIHFMAQPLQSILQKT